MGQLERDADAMLAGLALIEGGVRITFNNVTIDGALQTGSFQQTDETGVTTVHEGESFLIRTGAIAPKANDLIDVDGASYRVRDVLPEPVDGIHTRIVAVRV